MASARDQRAAALIPCRALLLGTLTAVALTSTVGEEYAEEACLLQQDLLVHHTRGKPALELGARQEPPTTTPDPTGMTLNGEGDLQIFLTAVFTNAFVVLFMFSVFMVLRLSYPIMYSHNVLTGLVKKQPENTYFGWISASLGTTTDEAIDAIGLDNAMMLEFCHLCMRILAIVGIPMLCIIGPMNWAFGGLAAGADHLSYLSFGNVENGNWLYWVHAVAVWGVVLTVQSSIYRAQRKFLTWRFTWLRKMAAVRANTVLVEGIPDEFQSDAKLADFFNDILPGKSSVKAAHVVKDTGNLLPRVKALEAAQQGLHRAEAQWAHDGKAADKQPMLRTSFMGDKVHAIPHYKKQIDELEPQVENARAELKAEAAKGPSHLHGNLSNAFITFNERISAEIVLRLDGVSADKDEWTITNPPEPADIQWNDLTQDPTAAKSRTIFGFLLVAALYFAYLPIVIGITNIANAIDMGPMQPLWAGFAPTLGLQFMVAMLPTFLINIFTFFFTLKAAAFAQHKLQMWYFWFQIVFVIMATAVGQNITGFMRTLVTDPFSTFGVLADTMPFATHFYMNFLVLQWMTHSLILTRYIPLSKFVFFKRIFDEDEAKQWAEPEDQDYYGLGSRSARWTILMVIGIVYGTLSPPINVLCFLTFALCRLIYGYLIVFAETKKPDLGGVFWVYQLRGLFVGNVIYCILMTGVFMRRAATYGPCALAAPSIFYTFWSMQRFDTAFAWETLPFEEIKHPADTKPRELKGDYVQPELVG